MLRFLNLKPEEVPAVRIMALYYFVITSVYVLGVSATPSIFYSRVPDAQVYYPILMTVNTIVAAPLVALFNRLVKRMSLVQLVVISNLFFAAIFIILEIILNLGVVWASALLFVMTIASFTIALFQYYLIAGTIFDARQSKRILGIIGIGGGLAGILSGLAIRPFTAFVSQDFLFGPEFGAESIIILMILLMLLTAFIVQRTEKYVRHTDEAEDETPSDTNTSGKIVFNGYLIAIMVILGAFILAATIIDYQFQTVSAEYYVGDEAGLTAFKGYYAAASGVIQMILRLFFVGPLLVNFGLLAGILALPAMIIATTLSFVTTGSLWSATMMKGGDQTIRFTVNETVMELVWAPIPTAERLVAKPFINGTFVTIVQGVTGIGLFLVKQNDFGGLRLFSFVVLAVTFVWIPAAVILRRGYVSKLMDSIKSHDFHFEEMNINAADAAIVRTVDEVLRTGDEIQQAFVLEILKDTNVQPWSDTLRNLYEKTDSIPIQAQIILLTASYPDIIPDAALLAHIEANDDLTDECIFAAGERRLDTVKPLLQSKLQHYRIEVQVAAARALLEMDGAQAKDAARLLQKLIQSAGDESTVAGLRALRDLPPDLMLHVVPVPILRDLLTRSNIVHIHALELIGACGAPMIPDVVLSLGGTSTFNAAKRTLQQYPADEVRQRLLHDYQKHDTPWAVRVGVVKALRDYLSPTVATMLIDRLTDRSRVLYNESVETLLHHAREKMLTSAQLAALEGEGLKLAQSMYRLSIADVRLAEVDDEPLMRDVIETDFAEAMPTMLKLSIMDVPQTDIESVILRLQHESHSSDVFSNVLEILDNVLSHEERQVIVPLFEGRTAEELAKIGKRHFPDMDTSFETELINYINSGDDWQAAVALNYIMRHPHLNIHIGRSGQNISEHSRELIAKHGSAGQAQTLLHRHDGQEEKMYSVLEKTILLKKSTLFEDVNTRDLYHIAQISETLMVSAGTVLFNKGDNAESMYIVGVGQVKIYIDDVEIAIIESGEAIGEIALLDTQPRTASAVAVTDVKLLAIEANDFFRTVAIHPDINRAIMKMLASRMRNLLTLDHQRTIAASDNLLD